VSDAVFSLYIIRCTDDSLYTGIAADVARRLSEHETSPRGAKYLRGKGPLKLEFSETVGDRATATALEYRVKRLTRAHKEAIIDGRESLRDLLDGLRRAQVSAGGDG